MTSSNRRHLLALAALGLTGLAAGGQLMLKDEAGAATAERFDEVYQGRRIQGTLFAGAGRHLPLQSVLIDGRPLHVMRDQTGCFISAVEHYRPARTLREVACRAVDKLDGAQLVVTSHQHGAR